MKRFLCIVFFLLGWIGPLAPDAVAKERMIAVIMAAPLQRNEEIHEVFSAKAKNFCSGDCRIYVQTPNQDIMSLRNSVRKAVALGADLIITYGTSATLAANAEVPNVPALFVDVCEPVRLGLVSEREQTGRNMTGVRGDAPVQALFKYFSESTGARKLVVVYAADSREGAFQKKLIEESGRRRGVDIIPLPVKNGDEIIDALNRLPAGVDGIFVARNNFDRPHLQVVLDFAAARKLPVMTQQEGAADMGAFMVLETGATEQGEALAEFASKIMTGAHTDDLPMYVPHRPAFIVNMKIARQYGIQVPLQVLSVATRVVH